MEITGIFWFYFEFSLFVTPKYIIIFIFPYDQKIQKGYFER